MTASIRGLISRTKVVSRCGSRARRRSRSTGSVVNRCFYSDHHDSFLSRVAFFSSGGLARFILSVTPPRKADPLRFTSCSPS